MGYLASLAGVDTVVLAACSVAADDAHVLGVGEGVRGRVGGAGRARPAPREPHQRGGGRARGLDVAAHLNMTLNKYI